MRVIDADAISVKSDIECVREVVEIILDEAPTLDVIVIPENATNGDMIKAMFSSASFVEVEYVPIIRMRVGDYYIDFTKDWWNAPYKGSEE